MTYSASNTILFVIGSCFYDIFVPCPDIISYSLCSTEAAYCLLAQILDQAKKACKEKTLLIVYLKQQRSLTNK
jgi:hypothetical protein